MSTAPVTKQRTFVHQWRSAVFNARMTSTERLTALTLAEFASTDGSDSCPALPTIAKFAGFNEKTIRTAVQGLLQAGWIDRKMKGGGHDWRYSEYALLLPEGADSTPARSYRRADTVPARSTSEGADSTPARSQATSGHSRRNVRTLTPEGAGPTPTKQEEQPGRANREELSDADASSVHTKEATKKSRNVPQRTAERFDDFWKAYPRKIGGKSVARKSWLKHRLDTKADLIIEAVRNRVVNDPGWNDTKFIPYPATYLNQERWEDEWATSSKRPSVADSFSGKVYTGTPEDELPYFLRVAI